MTGLSVIIPSKTQSNVLPCVQAIRQHESNVRIFVIDDGLPDRSEVDAITIDGVKPFVFARNCNIGIKATGDDDVCICNDDALLETPGGFTLMQSYASDNPSIGLVSSITNYAGNPEQYRRCDRGGRILAGKTLGNSFPTVAFVCVLIPRRTIDQIGLLDERFTAYGFEDNDYCRRLHGAGLLIGIHDGCYVDHAKLKSTFRGDPATGGKLAEGRKIYLDKWGSM